MHERETFLDLDCLKVPLLYHHNWLTHRLCIKVYRIFLCFPPSEVAVGESEAILIPDLNVFSSLFWILCLKNSGISWCCTLLWMCFIIMPCLQAFSGWRLVSFSPRKFSWNYFVSDFSTLSFLFLFCKAYHLVLDCSSDFLLFFSLQFSSSFSLSFFSFLSPPPTTSYDISSALFSHLLSIFISCHTFYFSGDIPGVYMYV